MYTVTVLTPKGRRQQVKVTPNTTILQILEEVCSKHGLKAEEYDIRHHNKILDTSSMFRFTSLPNNAQLEMTEALKRRQESSVTLGVQFETGERQTGIFNPSESIWDVIISLKPDEVNLSNLVVIYMRQEIYGYENLKKTTLRSLGLTGGRAILRVLHRSPEELHVQANVSSALPRIPTSEKEEKKAKKSPELSKKERGKTPSPELAKKNTKYLEPDYFKGNIFENLFRSEKAKKVSEDPRTSESSDFSFNYQDVHGQDVKNFTEPKAKFDPISKTVENNEPIKHSEAIFLGERNAVAFNLNNVKPMEFEEEPDGFFDLTVQDAKLLLKQAKQLCVDLEEAPLMTSAQRELEKDKKILTLLNQYKKTVLRVKFPDRTVLQGTFAPLETVSAVEKFVYNYLEMPKPPFYLYTTPPKVILKSDTRLIECGCVPSCVLYFGMPPDVPIPNQFLKSEVLGKLSSPSAAALQAYEARKTDKKLEKVEAENLSLIKEKRGWLNQNSEPGPSGNQKSGNQPDSQGNSGNFKIPKWFRSNK